MKKIVLIFFSIFQMTSCSQSAYDRDKPEEYIGCFTEDINRRAFNYAPGDYRTSELTPVQCMILCGQKYRYAAVQHGIFCMCSDVLPSQSADEAKCSSSCPGASSYPTAKPKCGGVDTVSVYSIENRILGLKIKNPVPIHVFQQSDFNVLIRNGKEAVFDFNFGDGDGSKPLKTKERNISHIYDRPGNYEVTLTASNNMSGTVQTSKLISVRDEPTGVSLNCPKATVFGQSTRCNGTMSRGSRIDANVDFGDGVVEHISFSAQYSHVGRKIPSFKILNEEKQTSPATFVIPSSSFKKAETVSNWEVDAFLPGQIRFQIFRPKCTSGEEFCHKKQSCVSKGSTCEDITKHSCTSNQIFCLHCGRCLPLSSQLDMNCSSYQPFHFSQPPSDFELVYQYQAAIPRSGHHFIHLQSRDMFNAKPGDVIGWTFDGKTTAGQAASASVGEDAAEFQFPALTEIGKTLNRKDGAKSARHHIISAHFYNKAVFTLHHTYNKTGAHFLSTNITKPVEIFVDIPIKGAKLVCPSLVKTKQSFTINIASHTGSNVTYTWLTGDGSSGSKTKLRQHAFVYHQSGEYHFTLTCSNSLSHVTLGCMIRALDAVSGLKFRKPIGAVSLGKVMSFDWSVSSGTNVTYVVDFGDGGIPRMIQPAESNKKEFYVEYIYKNVGRYNVSVTANNILGPKVTVVSTAVVQVPVKGMKFYSNLPHVTNHVFVVKGEIMQMSISLSQGSSPVCMYRISDQSAHQTTTSFSIKHRFSNTGTFTANATCMNHVSSINASLNATIVVQQLEAIEDMKLTTSPTVFGKATKLLLSMRSGSVYFCDWQFSDGKNFRSDFLTNAAPIYHTFAAVGDYTVHVSCSNRLGSNSTTATVVVDTPISQLEMLCPPRFLRVKQSFSITAKIATGSRVVLDFSWGGKETRQSFNVETNKSLQVFHSYENAGLYEVSVTARNQYERVQRNCSSKIKVEHPVQGLRVLTNSPLKLTPGVVTYRWFPNPGFVPPTDALISWEFGDGNKTDKYKLEMNKTSNVLYKYKFTSPGVYSTKVRIENNVSSMKFDLTVDVQKVLPIVLTVQQKTANAFSPGFGTENNIFPLENQIVFSVTKQAKDNWYYFDFADSKTLNSTSPSVTKRFSKAGSFNVSVRIDNVLLKTSLWKVVKIQHTIKNLVMHSSSRVELGKVASFVIRADDYGSRSCLVLNLGDSNVLIFNKTKCVQPPDCKINKCKLRSFPAGIISLNHTYHAKGSYKASLKAVNDVSLKEVSSTVEVFYKPCDSPRLVIIGGGTEREPMKSLRSEKIFVQANSTIICDKSSKVIFTWEILMKDKVNKSTVVNKTVLSAAMPFEQSPGTLDPTDFEISSNSLKVGINIVKLTVSLESSAHDLNDVTGTAMTWFDVQATPLKAVIKGGFRRAVGHAVNLKLDGSGSHDPDFSKTDDSGIQYLWYCRRKNEEFGQNFKPVNKTLGCFANGQYNLSSSDVHAKTIEIFTGKLIPHLSYVIRLAITKDSRESFFDQEITILPGNPPTMDIKCKMNCLEKLSAADRLILESVCTDCSSDTQLSFMWSLHEIVSTTSQLEITSFSSNTTTGIRQANIVVKENALRPGKKYNLKISAWKPHSSKDEGGYSEYTFRVNTPPSSGSCKVEPSTGFALVTKFKISCSDWVDDDMPLEYKIDVIREGNVANIYTGFENKIETVLPMGKRSTDYKMEIIAKVNDKYGSSTRVSLHVQVKEPVSLDLDAVSQDLAKLSSAGSVQTLAQQAVAVGSVMNTKSNRNSSDQTAKTESIQARTSILLSVSKVKACSLDQIRQMGDVYKEMTDKPEEVSQDAQDVSSSAMSAMSDCMLQSNPQDPSVKLTAMTMLQSSSKLLEANLVKVGNNSSNVTANGTVDAQMANASSKMLDTVDKVGGSLLRQLVAGDKPTVMKLPNMDLEMSQVGEGADEDSTGFKIPKLDSLLGNDTSDGAKQSIGAMVSSMSKNPYGQDSSSADIKSNILGLALTDKNGNAVDVAGQELQMFVSRGSNDYVTPGMNQFDSSGTMRFHKFNYSSLENGVVFEVKPLDSKLKLRLLISYGKRPSFSSFYKNHTFKSGEDALKQKTRLPDPFTYVISNGQLNQTGEYYVGIAMLNWKEIYSKFGYVPSLNYTSRIFETKCKVWDDDLKKWSSNGCKVGPKTTFNKTHCICKIEDTQEDTHSSTTPSTSVNAPPQGFASLSQGFAASSQDGSVPSQGLAAPQLVHKKRKVVKRVSFAGGFFVAPNPIDFDKAFAGFANLSENPVAFSTVLAIFGVYLIMLFWARREDRKDIIKAGVAALQDNDPSDRQFYQITVFTGFGNSAGTTSRVFIQLTGEDGSSEPRELSDASKVTFQKRGQDVFLASFEDFLGDLTYLKIWHDNSGKRPSWYMSKVAIHDLNTDKKYLFINETWLAVEEGDGSVEKVLPVAGADEIASFNHLFYSTTQKNLTDSHIWFSVFIRPAKSRFTRVQRLSCCLTLIYCTMLTNAMFYQVGGQSNPSTTLKLGPFEFSAAQLGIGVMSSLIIFPVNLLIVGVFRSVGAKPSAEELKKKKSRKMWWIYEFFFCCQKKSSSSSEFMNIITTVPDSEVDLKKKAESKPKYKPIIDQQLESGDIGLKLDNEDNNDKKNKSDKKKKKRKLPWWMKYFAWTLLVLTSFTSAFFVVLYGFQFGKDKSAQWISSMLISFVQDVFISQPIKIVFLGLFVALIVKKPAEDEEEENKKKDDEHYLFQNTEGESEGRRQRSSGIIKFEPPPKEKIQAARDLRLKEIKMYGIVKDILIYFIFVMALCTVSYTHLDPKSFQFKKGLEDIFISGAYGGDVTFEDINTREDYWSWLNDTAVNGLYSTTWYNSDPNIRGFMQDLYSNLFGGARIRQLRVKKNSCKVPEEVAVVTTDCNDFYSWSDEDTGDYGLNWQPIKNTSVYKKPHSSLSWKYFTSDQLNTYPFAGEMAIYGGGGYVGDLGKYPAKAYKLINELKKNDWFDRRTRAVFLEACVYNAQVNLFAIMNFVVEFLPTNGIATYHSVKIARLYTFGGSTQSFTIACQFFVMFFLLLFVYRESKKIYKDGKKYFKGFWNLTEFTMIILVLVTISVFFSRMLLVNSAVKDIHDNPGKFVSFNKVAKWDDLFQYMMSFLVMVACVKSIRLLSFNKTISLLSSTLKGSAKPLSAFSVVFLIFFMAYTIFAFIIFVEQLEDFKSFVTAIESTMALLLGSFEFEDIKTAQPILGPIYFLTLMLFGVMYILNVFLSIVMDTYADVKANISKQSREYEIVDFMISRFKRFVGIQPGSHESDVQKEMKNQAKEEQTAPPHGLAKLNHRLKKAECDEEDILKKFNKLNQSLNGFCKDDYAEDDFVDSIIRQGCTANNASGMRKQMHFDETKQESEYQQELYDELHKWS